MICLTTGENFLFIAGTEFRMIAGCASKKGEEVYKTARYLETHNTGSPLKDQVKQLKVDKPEISQSAKAMDPKFSPFGKNAPKPENLGVEKEQGDRRTIERTQKGDCYA